MHSLMLPAALFERFFSVTVTQPVQLGMKDSLDPYVVSAVLLFIVLLYFVKRDRLPVNVFCGFFIVGYVLSVPGLMFGVFEPFLNNFLFTKIVQISNIVVGALFVVIGFLNLYDWWQLRKNDAFNQLVVKALLFFSEEALQWKKLGFIRRVIFMIGAFSWGVLGSLLGAAWGPDKDLFIMFQMMVLGNNTWVGVKGIFLYALVVGWLLYLIWFLNIFIRWSKGARLFIEKNISLIKIFGSAVFLATGLGIIYLSIK